MGLRGPAPKPNVVKMLMGNPGKRPLNLDEGIIPDTEIPGAPEWLNKDARLEWRRIGPELERLGLISKIDRSALALYCQTWGQLCQAERSFSSLQRRAGIKARALRDDEDDAMMEPFVHRTSEDVVKESGLFGVIFKLRESVNKYLGAFGLSPSSRSRFAGMEMPKGKQSDKPKKDDGDKPTLRSFA